MEKSQVLRYLKEFVKSKQESKTQKGTAQDFSALSTLKEEEILFGEPPKYFFAKIICNSTGVGTSYFHGTETQRTIARDYVTDEHLFIDGDVGAGAKGLSLFFLKPNQTINYYKKSDVIKVAKEYGFQLHLQDFRDLNFTMTDHRLNRHKVQITREPFTYPIRPIYGVISEDGDKITLGYVYEAEGNEYIIIEPEDPSNLKKAKKGCAPWMILGLFFPPIWLVAAFVWLVKVEKERMRG